MTVATEACGPTALRWTGVETVFPAGFPAQTPDAIKVYYLLDGGIVTTALSFGVHYTVTLDGAGLATVLPAAMPAAPGTLTMVRQTPGLQATDFQNLARFDAAIHTRLHDASAMRDNEIRRDLNLMVGVDGPAIIAEINLKRAEIDAQLAAAAAIVGSGAYIQTGTGAVSRSVQAGVRDRSAVLTEFNGVVGNNINDDAPGIRLAVQAAIDNGLELIVPPGYRFRCNSVVNNAVIDLGSVATRNKSLRMHAPVPWNMAAGTNWNGGVFVLGPAIPDSADFLHAAGTQAINGGFSLKHFGIVAYTGTYDPAVGRHGIFIDATASDNYSINHGTIEGLFVSNMKTGQSIRCEANASNPSGAWSFGKINNNFAMSIYVPGFGDDCELIGNKIGFNATGTNHSIYGWNVPGATSTRVRDNVLVGFHGMFVWDGGVDITFADNEMEMSNVVNSYGTLVDFRGSVLPIFSPMVTGNSISMINLTTGYVPLSFNNTRDGVVLGNGIRTLAGGNHIVVSAAAVDLFIGKNGCGDGSGAVPPVIANASTTLAVLTSFGGKFSVNKPLGPPLAAFDVNGAIKTDIVTVAQLGSCGSGLSGIRRMVSDATATAFYSAVSGGGGNAVPVFCDGATATWRIG